MHQHPHNHFNQPGQFQPNFYIGQVGTPICEWILLESAIPPCSLCVSQTFGSLLLLLYWTNMVILDFNISLCLIHLIHTAWLPKGRKERRGLTLVLIDLQLKGPETSSSAKLWFMQLLAWFHHALVKIILSVIFSSGLFWEGVTKGSDYVYISLASRFLH